MSEEFEVGYKKPPKAPRFKPGVSGNPRGRGSKTLNLKTDLQQELAERIPIREGDRSLRVSKQRALLKAMLAKALKGDVRAANVVLQLIAKVITPDKESDPAAEIISDDELAIVESFIARRSSTATKPQSEP